VISGSCLGADKVLAIQGRLMEKCGLEPQTNFFPFKKSPKPEYGLGSGADYIREYTVYQHMVISPVY
jgi:hypothetical protein